MKGKRCQVARRSQGVKTHNAPLHHCTWTFERDIIRAGLWHERKKPCATVVYIQWNIPSPDSSVIEGHPSTFSSNHLNVPSGHMRMCVDSLKTQDRGGKCADVRRDGLKAHRGTTMLGQAEKSMLKGNQRGKARFGEV